jgi:hypothetical protein
MPHRWSVPVLVVLAAIGGYALAGLPVQAQDAFPLRMGETVRFTLVSMGMRECKVMESRGTFVRCQTPPGSPRLEWDEEWINVSEAIGIDRKTR